MTIQKKDYILLQYVHKIEKKYYPMQGAGPKVRPPTIGDIICSFKTRKTGYIIKEIKNGKIEAFEKKIMAKKLL